MTISVLVKVWMWWFNYALSRHIKSDALATSVVLLGLIIGRFAQVRLDGRLGMLVAVFILKTGLEAAKDTLNPLLGKAPEPEMVQNIEKVIQLISQRLIAQRQVNAVAVKKVAILILLSISSIMKKICHKMTKVLGNNYLGQYHCIKGQDKLIL